MTDDSSRGCRSFDGNEELIDHLKTELAIKDDLNAKLQSRIESLEQEIKRIKSQSSAKEEQELASNINVLRRELSFA